VNAATRPQAAFWDRRYHPAGMPDTLQRLLGGFGALLTLPLVAALALAIRLESPGPAIYVSDRIGGGGRPFRCHKLRTMGPRTAGGPAITVHDDPRVTRLGRLLRRLRLDELPQLWDVALGRMRLVGPRPEAPEFVDFDDPLQRLVVDAPPGITGLAQLFFTDEAAMLAGPDPERRYRSDVLPRKLRLDAAYLRHRSAGLDLWILGQTPLVLFGRRPVLPPTLRAELGDA
jgi:lipopolysaccharide/colanic/teichoic acid biosynthesis glycosyltransferase